MSEHTVETVTIRGVDVQVSITTHADIEKEGEAVHLHTHNAAVKAMQTIKHGGYPEEHDGMAISVNWDRIHELLEEGSDE